MPYLRAQLVECYCRENTTAHREGFMPLRNVHVRATARSTWLDRTLRGVVEEQQAKPVECCRGFSALPSPHCLRRDLLGVQRCVRVVSDRRCLLLHGRGVPRTSAEARLAIFSNMRWNKALSVFVRRSAGTTDPHSMWHNICVYI